MNRESTLRNHSSCLLGLLVAALTMMVGCIGEIEEGQRAEDYDDRLSIAASGRWLIPSNINTIGNKQHVSYTGGGSWNGTGSCSGNFTGGAAKVKSYVAQHFSKVSSIGGYACRPNTANTSKMSVHGTGRALDIMIPTIGGSADNTAGDAIAHYMITHAEEIGIQLIIWDRTLWNASKSAGSKSRRYGGPHPHNDHLHVELSVAGGKQQTPWFSGTPDAPGGGGGGTGGGGGGGGGGGSACQNSGGMCHDIQTSTCSGQVKTGLCPGDSNNLCCMGTVDGNDNGGGTGGGGTGGGTGGTTDFCEAMGWYGDGQCDVGCPKPDTADCSGSSSGSGGSGGSGGYDVCEQNGWYGDGPCDDFCPKPDSDCQGW